jgi:hypothetical protein
MRLNYSVLGWGMVALAVFAGCSEDNGVADQRAGNGPAAAVDAKVADGWCGLQSMKGVKLEWGAASGNGQLVRVSNLRDVAGVVKLTRTLVTAEGTVSADLGETAIGPGQSADIPIPAMDNATSEGGSSLHITGLAEFADGEQAGASVTQALAPAAKVAALINPGDIGGPTGIVIPSGWVRTRLCFEYPGDFPETWGDEYTEGVPTYRPARTLRVNVWGPSSFKLKEYLNADGCTSLMDFPLGSNTIRIYTGGEWRGSTFDVVDDAQGSEVLSFDFKVLVLGSGPTMKWKFDPTASPAAHAFNVAQLAGHVFMRVPVSDAPALLIIANATGVTKSNYLSRYHRIALEAGDHDSKRTIAHEIGHWAMDSQTDFNGGSCGKNGHDALSYENQGCALSEGYANWWAALTFNNTSHSDCRYSSVDCVAGPPTGWSCSNKSLLPSAVMETCHADKDFAGAGNETDWMRVLWNIRAPFGSTQEQISEWINTANDVDGWTTANVYSLLNSRANAIGGTLNKRFDANKSLHGVNHNP